jgi:hypothetical protein
MKHRIIIETLGGLGNQLFQIANGLALGLRFNRPIMFKHLDTFRRSYLAEIGIESEVIYAVSLKKDLELKPIFKTDPVETETVSRLQEKEFHFEAIRLPTGPVSIRGYFQSYRYFYEFEDSITDFFWRSLFSEQIRNREDEVEDSEKRDEIAVHVRLGDYVNSKTANAYHGLLSEEYFLKAVEMLSCEAQNLLIVAESQTTLRKEYPTLSKLATKIISSCEVCDLYALSRSTKLILSNSSFSWWGAYLSEAKVIAPKNWFSAEVLLKNSTKDLYLPHWEII